MLNGCLHAPPDDSLIAPCMCVLCRMNLVVEEVSVELWVGPTTAAVVGWWI